MKGKAEFIGFITNVASVSIFVFNAYAGVHLSSLSISLFVFNTIFGAMCYYSFYYKNFDK